MSARKAMTFFRDRVPGMWRFGTHVWWRIRLSVPWLETSYFRALRKMGGAATRPGSSGRRILFFATRQERDQLAVVATLAWALRRRGHDPVVLGCDRALTHSCNSGNYPALDPWQCRTCALYARHSHAVSGLGVAWLGDLLPHDARAGAVDVVDATQPDGYRDLTYRGLAIGRLVRPSVAHFLRSAKITDDPASLGTYREWLISAVWLVDACERLLDRDRPDVIVMLNGLFAPEWIMLEVAKRRGVRVVTWEVGFRPETFFFAHGRPTDMADPRLWAQFRGVALTPEEDAQLDRYLRQRAAGGGYLLNYFPNLDASIASICAQFGIDRTKKVAVLFPNITWDSTLFERDVGFDGMSDWLAETIQAFAGRADAQLVIRVHPAEAVLPGAGRDSVMAAIAARFPRLPPNVVVVPPDSGASSYALMDLADCGLVYGSTTGLEMGVRGVPVVLAGDVYYRGLGLTIDPATRQEYRRALDDVLSGRIARSDPARIEAWRRYVYYAVFRAAVPLRQVSYQTAGKLPTLRFDAAAELDEGRDPNLDAVCGGILEGTPILAATTTVASGEPL